LHAAEPAEPMMYKLRRGSDLEIRHLIQLKPCENLSELKSLIVEVMKQTKYPAQHQDNLKVDLYYKSVFESKCRLASMTRDSHESKAKLQLFIPTLKRCLEELKSNPKIYFTHQKKRAS
jgi:hypothetical protein